MLQTLIDLLRPALMRFALYAAVAAFGFIGAFIEKLGFGTFDEVARTITISEPMFTAAFTVMIVGGLTAMFSFLMGWRGRRTSEPPR